MLSQQHHCPTAFALAVSLLGVCSIALSDVGAAEAASTGPKPKYVGGWCAKAVGGWWTGTKWVEGIGRRVQWQACVDKKGGDPTRPVR
jgi:hypothetical protein